MAPKRTSKVVKTTKKVLEETVEILTVPGDSQNGVDVPPGSSKVIEIDVPIADKPTQEEEDPKEAAEKGSGGNDKNKEAEPRNPKKVEKPPQREAPAEKVGGRGSDDEREKQANPRTPRTAEQPPKREAAEKGRDRERQTEGRGRTRRTRRRMKRYSGPGGGVGEMDGVGRGYKRYVFQVLKQMHPELGISSRAMAVVDGLLGDMFERLADEAARLSAYVGKTTLSSREIQGAVQLVLPGELGKHAITEGTNAVTTYLAAAAADVAK